MNLRSVLRRRRGILLIECMIHLAVSLVLISLGYVLTVRFLGFHDGLGRSATDIARAIRAGEEWRKDIRSATGSVRLLEDADAGLVIPSGEDRIVYRFDGTNLWRGITGRVADQVRLEGVAACDFHFEERSHVRAWRWELRMKAGRKEGIRPLFTFLSVEP